jgi:hypothetical protein
VGEPTTERGGAREALIHRDGKRFPCGA